MLATGDRSSRIFDPVVPRIHTSGDGVANTGRARLLPSRGPRLAGRLALPRRTDAQMSRLPEIPRVAIRSHRDDASGVGSGTSDRCGSPMPVTVLDYAPRREFDSGRFVARYFQVLAWLLIAWMIAAPI